MLHLCFSKLSYLNYDIFGQFVLYLLIFSQYKMWLKLLLCNYNMSFFYLLFIYFKKKIVKTLSKNYYKCKNFDKDCMLKTVNKQVFYY